MSILAPLAARYASWLALPAEQTNQVETDPALVRAMPVILRIERDPVPGRTALLEAAASAALAVCLDPRATAPDGEWHSAVTAWINGHIRKVSRRARGAHWQAAQSFPGVTVTANGTSTALGDVSVLGGASVRALVPGLVTETPKEISRLQISGSDLPHDDPGPLPEGIPVLWLNPNVELTAGKAAAQVGHASMLLAALLDDTTLKSWAETTYRCAVRTPTQAQWKALHPGTDPAKAWDERRVIAVRDAGFTEIAPGTVTVLAQWPP
ncbi:peptidyl-tRNA hydrolase [Actinocrispum sp. NPDC049592]|uniref:peptidyl-tRNA hydrolase n=1 Tax=Actinocrispum sp. NPDC049592 TaxID=3154835 RepID=UPI003443C559